MQPLDELRLGAAHVGIALVQLLLQSCLGQAMHLKHAQIVGGDQEMVITFHQQDATCKRHATTFGSFLRAVLVSVWGEVPRSTGLSCASPAVKAHFVCCLLPLWWGMRRPT